MPICGKYHHPSLQCFVVAPSASGKGILSYIRLLVEPIHDEIRKEVAIQMKAYKKEKAEYDAMGKERTKKEAPQMPPNRMFLISGNNTGTGILQNIMDSDGTGLICEAEADTLSTAIGSDHGHWSDTLRKAFDHDRLSYNRRTDQEYREVKKSYLSVLISGTPSQVQTFIPTAEDGSYSRQLYYYMCGISKWISQFMDNEIDWEEIFTAMGLEWKEKLSVIKAHGIHTLQLTDEQKEEIDTVFSDLFERSSVANGREMYSFVARLAVNLCRIMSEVAVLRASKARSPTTSRPLPPLLSHRTRRFLRTTAKMTSSLVGMYPFHRKTFMLCLVLRNLSTVMPRIFYRSSPIQKSATVLMPIVIISSRNWVMNLLVHSYWKKQLPWELRKTQPSLG